MASDLDQYYRYDRYKGQSMDDCKILKRDIINLIQKFFLKNFMAQREQSRSPRHEGKNISPRR